MTTRACKNVATTESEDEIEMKSFLHSSDRQETDSKEQMMSNSNRNPTTTTSSSETKGNYSMRRIVSITLLMGLAFQIGKFFPVSKTETEKTVANTILDNDANLPMTNVTSKNNEKSENGDGISIERVHAIRRKAEELLEMLEDYYSVYDADPYHILAGGGGWARPWNFTQIIPSNKQQQQPNANVTREEKLVDTMARAMLNPTQTHFKIGVIGSSVAAGHDNCRYDNYESQLTRTLSPLWETAGMEFTIQNAGEGGACGDSHRNQVYCITQNVSPDVDIVHYSWTYFGEDSNEKESLIRWSQMMDHQPPVHVVNVGGKGVKQCLDSGTDENLLDHYGVFGYNGFCMRKAFLNGGNNDEVIFEGKHVGDAFFNTTRYGEDLQSNTAEVSMSAADAQLRKDSLGVIMRNWHPGPLGFQMISDAMAYVYATAMIHAIDRIEAKFSNPSEKAAKQWESRPILLKDDLPSPKFCDPRYCSVDTAPTCLNFEKPTFGWYGASIAPPDDELNPYRGTKQNWIPYTKPVNPPTYMIPKLEQKLYQQDPDKCQFPDRCGAISAEAPRSGRLVFKLPKMEVGVIAVCVCCGKDVAELMVLKNEFLQVELNGLILNHTSWDIWPEKKCVRLVSQHGNIVGDSGHSYLSLSLLEGNTQIVKISHVITI